MSRRDDSVPMRHMLDHAREAVGMVSRRTRADLGTDRMLQLALVHLVEIVGEAANRVSKTGQAQHPDIPWRSTVDLCNRVVHGYDTVDYDRVWHIVVQEFPGLIAALERALPGHKG